MEMLVVEKSGEVSVAIRRVQQVDRAKRGRRRRRVGRRLAAHHIRHFEKNLKEKCETSLVDSVTRDRCYDFLNSFAEKISEKLAFLTQSKAKLCKILIITLVFEKTPNYFAENCRKSQKFVIITSTPDWGIFHLLGDYLLWAVF
jgi:hypothetical protein